MIRRLYIKILCHLADCLFTLSLKIENMAIGKDLIKQYQTALRSPDLDPEAFLQAARDRAALMPPFSSSKQSIARLHNQIKRMYGDNNPP